MAKRKEEIIEDTESPSDFTAKVLKLIKKDFGENIAVSGDKFLTRKLRVIPISPSINLGIGGGVPEGSWFTLSGKPKCGKALLMNSKLYTKNAIINMSDAKVGMEILVPNGYAKIIGVYPQGKTKTYKVIFNDNSFVTTSPEHIWEISDRNGNMHILTTKDMLNKGILLSDRPKFYIATSVALFDNEIELPINPYLLGVLIGDGSLTHRGIGFSNIDSDLINNVRLIVEPKYSVVTSGITHTISNRNNFQDNNISKSITDLGLRCTAHHKFIPEMYKYSSYSNRIMLIEGLMDTDGSVSKRGHCEYTTVSIKLAQDFKFLIESIGGICTIKERFTKCLGKEFLSYRCHINHDSTKLLFGIPRKINRCKDRIKRSLKRSIVAIIEDEDAETQCIEVDSKNHLFLTNNFIATHNTVTALHFAAKCQQEKYGSKHIYYLNVEGRLKEMNLNGITGLKTTPDCFTIIGSEEDKILSAQDYLNIAEKVLLTHPECVLIIDSFSMLCHEKEITDGIGTSTRGGGAALLAQFCRQMANVVPVKRSIVVGIAQLMANTSGYGAAIMEKGGNGIQYQVDVKMRCKTTEPWEHNGKRVGQKLTWTVECSALGMPPGQEFESYIRYNHGIDEIKEVICLGTDIGIIAQSGAWYYCDFMQSHLPSIGATEWTEEVRKKCRAQGEDKLYELIKENPDWIGFLEKHIKTALGI